MSPISVANIITSMTRPDAMAPIVALEATVTGGRTLQAKKRGGKDEARERLIEESTGAVVWLGGVKVLNSIGDKILGKMFGGNFDVGTDKVLRTPFDNFMKKNPPKGFSAKQVALIKTAKVLTSVVLADAFIGLVVPPLNHRLTRNLSSKRKQKEEVQDKLELQNNNQVAKNPTFKGALQAINVFTNAIENTNTGKLLSTDAGLVSGRMYSARNNDERREIAIRDIGSIYFYMWAQNHVGNLINFAESGSWHRLNPTSATTLTEHLEKFVESKGGELSVEEFKKLVLGSNSVETKQLENIKFEVGEYSMMDKLKIKMGKTPAEPLKVIKLSELEGVFTDKELMSRIEGMSKLQPLRQGEAVVTKQQIIDAMNKAEINNPELLDKMFTEFTGGASKDEFKFVSNKKLYNFKKEMEQYVETICKDAKNGKVNKDILKKAKNKNIHLNGINFAAGFVVAAIFLSTLIPKFQYWVTRQKTGKDLIFVADKATLTIPTNKITSIVDKDVRLDVLSKSWQLWAEDNPEQVKKINGQSYITLYDIFVKDKASQTLPDSLL